MPTRIYSLKATSLSKGRYEVSGITEDLIATIISNRATKARGLEYGIFLLGYLSLIAKGKVFRYSHVYRL